MLAKPRNPRTTATARCTASSPSPNNRAAAPPWHCVVVGNPGSNRVGYFQAALARLGLPAATVVSYLDLLTGRDSLERELRPGTVVRLESPGRDFEVEKALLAAGAEVADADGPTRISR